MQITVVLSQEKLGTHPLHIRLCQVVIRYLGNIYLGFNKLLKIYKIIEYVNLVQIAVSARALALVLEDAPAQGTEAAPGTAVQQVVLDAQPTVVAGGHGVPAVVIVTVVAVIAETPVLPVLVVAGDALVALAVQIVVVQLVTVDALHLAHQAAATRRGLEV